MPPTRSTAPPTASRGMCDDVADDAMSISCDWRGSSAAAPGSASRSATRTCHLRARRRRRRRAMPAEIGWHPWFVKPEPLSFRPASMYARDDEGIPSGELVPPPPGPWDDCFLNTEPVELRYAALTVTVTSRLRPLGRLRRTRRGDVRRTAVRSARRVQPPSTGARTRRAIGPHDDHHLGRSIGMIDWRRTIR